LHHAQQLPHRRLQPHELLARLQAVDLALGPRCRARGLCFDRLPAPLELARLAGLGEEVVGAVLHGANRLLHGAVGGQHHHLGGGRDLADLLEQVEAAAVGHAHVEHDQVE
jgi:hypothetical protein